MVLPFVNSSCRIVCMSSFSIPVFSFSTWFLQFDCGSHLRSLFLLINFVCAVANHSVYWYYSGGTGIGATPWSSLRFVFGVGAGCGIGVGYGYGFGLGVRWDKPPQDVPKRVVIEL